jgi:uncharacterized hydrophobic protein (TIGR00271 family)
MNDKKKYMGYANRVVVPIANPRTSAQLLRFAASLTHPEKGRIKALYIRLPNSTYEDVSEKLEKICHTISQSQDVPVELMVMNATTVPRGVLDAVREVNADLLVLGFQAPRDGHFVIGDVTEEVARVTTNDLIVYRHVPDGEIKRVLVPVTDLAGTQSALLHAAHLASFHDVPLYAIYVETSTPTPFWKTDAPPPIWQQMSLMEAALLDEPYYEQVQHKVIKAQDIVAGVVEEATQDDVIVLSVQRSTSNLNKWLFGPTAQKMLRLAPGALALVKRHDNEDDTILERVGRYMDRWTPRLTLTERTEVISQAGDLVRANTNYLVMVVLSSILASIGLLQSSAAVIIGAMLVAPLMSPLMGFGVGLSLGDLTMMRKSAVTIVQGIFLVLLVAVFVGFISAFPLPTPEMLARGEPTFLDMMVALASGVAGAFALARKDIPAALAGTAIAAALVPPICTTGLALALGNMDLMVGAGLLTVVNVICISIAAAGTFAIMGVRSAGEIPTLRRLIVSGMLLVLIGIPMSFLLLNATRQSRIKYETEQILEERFRGSEVISVAIEGDAIIVTMRSPQTVSLPEMVAAEADIEERIDEEISLHLIVLPVVQAQEPNEDNDSQ